MAEEGADRCWQSNFTQKEIDILVLQVEAHNWQIHSFMSEGEVKLAWEEVASIINDCSPGVMRNAAQYVMMWINCLIHIQVNR